MSKDPALLFYTSDFLTGTFTMSNEQVGKYIRLLCLQHQKGTLTEKDMLNICKTYDEDIFIKFKKNGSGNYYSERLKLEAEKRKAYSESRKHNREGKVKDKKNICKSYDSHMENEIEIEDEDINKGEVVKTKQHLFKNSEYYNNVELFVTDFELNDNYKIFDARYYYESVKNWSDGDNKKKANWVSTARNWALRDFKENKATLKDGQQTKTNSRGYVYDADKWARAGQS